MSRFAFHYSARRRALCGVLTGVGLILGVNGAYAQTMLPAKPVAAPVANPTAAAPVVGHAPLARSPLDSSDAGNRSRFVLVPSVRTTYDSNVLRYSDSRGDARGNIRTTPGVDIDYRRAFGRVALSLSGSAGYDFNSRFRFLNQRRIDLEGSARMPVGAICSAKLNAQFDQRRFEPGETETALGTTSTIQIYDLLASCDRRAGFAPVGEFTYRSLTSQSRSFFDYHQYLGRLGVSYTQPSIGTLTLSGTLAQLRRPDFAARTGIDDDTDVYSFGIGLNRAVTSRVQINVSGGITKANPKRASVPDFLGGAYSGTVILSPTERFALTLSALREVTNQAGYSATYVIREDYSVSARLKLTAKSRLRVAGEHIARDFRGENLFPGLRQIGDDRTTVVSGGYDYALSRKLRLGFSTSRRWRRADNSYYNYNATIVSTSIGANF